MYNPDHPEADEQGFRKDIMKHLKDQKTTLIRYPGGNYVSGYRWTDGIGPRISARSVLIRPELSIQTIGIDEYANYAKKLGIESMLVVNLGTGTAEEAANEVEYCNMASNLLVERSRRKCGNERPRYKLWGLGNEMTAPGR